MVAYGSRTAHSNLYHTWASVKTTDFHSWQVSAVVRPGKMWAEGAQTPIWIWTAKVVSMPVPERCWEMLGGFKHGLIFSMRAGIKLTICWDIVAVFQINIRPNTVWFSNSTDVVIVGMGVRSGEMAALTPYDPYDYESVPLQFQISVKWRVRNMRFDMYA